MGVSVVRGLVIFLLCSLSVACTTIGEKEEPNESGYSNEPLPLLFEGNNICGYYDDELLYLYYPTKFDKIVVYDKKYGLFTESKFRESRRIKEKTGFFSTPERNKRINVKASFKCSDYSIRLSDKLSPYENSIRYFILSNGVRAIFDNASKNPEIFKNEIKYNSPPYFKQVSDYYTKATVQVGNTGRSNRHSYLGDIKSYYNNLSPSEADKLINPVLAKIAEEQAEKERKEREEKLMIERFKMEQRIAQERWDNRLAAKYSIGDKVCTYDNNSFGYIEGLNASKMKVHVVGQANGKNGFFFSGRKGGFNYKPIEAIRWFNRSELAPCYFD